ncbi:TonB-dependent receptor [Aliarcobacter butzleri]|uniref:TonB-dependent receptor n=1 Tax=Aliarcobacter butzleri TaxID=28197 RepID=UPI00063AE150|nr:TonB-dependent receptor [Aliarcobacter butzleri]KLE07696.1 TonB-denpendent receptor [Aliarcobacter butzleri L354]MCG3693975.1 TonB-dependent receptor [Aliarcobacter butzleri]MDN5072229.1 TonB-dependent receptor [Aliarcobacter butzleri]MDN5077131.1 TonB-dependent receptor [Aliarcobacter butzleri]MDN5119026.1 TonB-dependent receptor [Aliarcobacter butzleri]
MLKKKNIILFSLFVSSLLFANETTKLEEITVSANKMEENIQDVPQSITVIDEETIEQKGIKNIFDAIKEVPNINKNSVYGDNISFRGLNTSMFTNNNPVVIYIDGVPYYDRFDLNPSLANVEQIEVLRGPQGTLYGKDAIGAVINITTKAPTNEWHGTLGAEYGNDNIFNTKLNTSGAIVNNKLFAGINGSFYHTDGWIENHYSGMDKDANEKNDRKTSGFLLYKPTDELSAKLTVSDNYEKKYFMDGIVITDPNIDINTLKRDDGKNINFDVPTFDKIKVKSQALNLSYELEKVKFDSVTTHKKLLQNGFYDADYLANNANDDLAQWNDTEMNTWSQEFKLSSKNQDIKWITGLYFDKEEREQSPYGGEQLYYGSVYYSNADSSTDSKTQAIFGQTMIPLGEDFELTLGGRYQKIKKEISADVLNTWGGITTADFSYNDKKTWNTFLPKAALSYKINDNLTTYVSISKGYMPGGFSYFPSNNISENNSFEPQKSINYEVGTKYIGETFALNAAIFRMNIEDIHVYRIDQANNFTPVNAKKAHSQGIELDGTYFLTDNLSLSGAVGLIQAKYDDYDNGTGNYNGEKIENTPSYTANFGISYLADKGIYGRLDFNAVGESNALDYINKRMLKTDGGITANAKIGYKIGTWDLYSYVNNITDEDYVTGYMAKNGLSLTTFNDPRRFGIGAIYKF